MAQQTPVSKTTTKPRQSATDKAIVTGYQKGASASSADRQQMIAEEAYLIAERRGFDGDFAMDDWLQAEATIDTRFAERH
mgnify:CR=1 FL=1